MSHQADTCLSVGGRRGIGLNEERDQTLNQLLTELDGFDGRSGVLMLAATNRPEVSFVLRAIQNPTRRRDRFSTCATAHPA